MPRLSSLCRFHLVRCSIRCDGYRHQPSGSVYKLNVDAAVFKGMKASGVGAMIHNENGEVMAAMAGKGSQVQGSEEAEALACRRAVEFAFEAGFREIILEGDNCNVMRSILGPKSDRDMCMMTLTVWEGSLECFLFHVLRRVRTQWHIHWQSLLDN